MLSRYNTSMGGDGAGSGGNHAGGTIAGGPSGLDLAVAAGVVSVCFGAMVPAPPARREGATITTRGQ